MEKINLSKLWITKKGIDKDRGKKKDNWDKFSAVGSVLVIPSIAAIAAAYGAYNTNSLSHDAVAQKYIEIATRILDNPNGNTVNTTQSALREWAISIVNNYSPVKLSSDAKIQIDRSGIGGSSFRYSVMLQNRHGNSGDIFLVARPVRDNHAVIRSVSILTSPDGTHKCDPIEVNINQTDVPDSSALNEKAVTLRIATSDKIEACMSMDDLHGYNLVEVSTDPGFTAYNIKGASSLRTRPFAIIVKYSTDSGLGQDFFGAYMQFLQN